MNEEEKRLTEKWSKSADEIGLDIQNSRIINTLPIFEIEGLKIYSHSKTHFLLENDLRRRIKIPIKEVEQILKELFAHHDCWA